MMEFLFFLGFFRIVIFLVSFGCIELVFVVVVMLFVENVFVILGGKKNLLIVI